MLKSLAIAILVLVLGASAFCSVKALDAVRAQDDQIAALRTELDRLRTSSNDRHSLDDPTVNAPRVVLDHSPTEGTQGERIVDAAGTGGEVVPTPPDPWVESLSRDKDRLAQLATLVKTQIEEGVPTRGRAQVRQTLEELREEEEQIRRERRRETLVERTREQVKGYAERLDLYPAEEEEMTQILVGLSEERYDFFQRAREGQEAWSGIREKMQEMTAASDEELKEVLSDDQFSEYEKIREEERARQGWGGWGRRNSNSNPENDTKSEETSPSDTQ